MRDKEVIKRFSVAAVATIIVLFIVVSDSSLRSLPPFLICATGIAVFLILFFRYPTPITFEMLSKIGELEKMIAEHNALIAANSDSQREANKRIETAEGKEAALKVSAREFVEQVKQKEHELAEKETALAKKADELNSRKQEIAQYESALYRTERTIRDWVTRREKDEIAIFDEIAVEVDKYKKLSAETTNMTGFEFEEYIGQLLKLNGYTDVEVTQKSQDFGADIVASLNRIKYVIQCKYYSSPVGIEAVQQIYSAKVHYNAHIAVVATNITFTKAAKTLATELGVVLWDCEMIDALKNKEVTQ